MLIGLQFYTEAIQVTLEEVLCGCIHHLCLDARCVRCPEDSMLLLRGADMV